MLSNRCHILSLETQIVTVALCPLWSAHYSPLFYHYPPINDKAICMEACFGVMWDGKWYKLCHDKPTICNHNSINPWREVELNINVCQHHQAPAIEMVIKCFGSYYNTRETSLFLVKWKPLLRSTQQEKTSLNNIKCCRTRSMLQRLCQEREDII